jgi:hypothetical protein
MPIVILAGNLFENLGKTGNEMEAKIEVSSEDRSWMELAQEHIQLRAFVSVTMGVQTVLP